MRKDKIVKAVAILMSVCMVAPATVFSNVTTKADVNGNVTATDKKDELKIEGDYFRQYMSVLLDQGKLKNDNNTIEMTKDEKSKSVIFSGTKENLLENEIVLDKTLNFNGSKIDRISLDAMSEKGTTVTLGIYVDGASEPIAKTVLNRQKKKNDWRNPKNISIDISSLNLIGEHTVQLKVLDASADNVKFDISSIEFVESTVPTIYFNIDESEGTIAEMNGSSDHSAECYGSMTMTVPDNYTCEYTGKKAKGGTYQLEYIRGRGNSTWSVDKKPYKIKLDKKADLLGMGKNKHWVLLANYYDNSLLRNKITYWLGSQLNMPFTPKSEPVDVVMNGEYYGSYFLCEHVRVGETRVNIDDLEANEDAMHETQEPFITGGYLLSLEPYGNEEKKSFKTKKSNTFLIESPSFEDYYNETQYNYIKNYVQSVEDAIYGKNFKNEKGVSYSDLMDVASTVYYYLIQEFSMNGDGYVSTSTYLYKPRNGKLFWGPLWDFDYVAWGSTEYDDFSTTGWTENSNMWLERLFEDESFSKKVVDSWPELKAAVEELIKDGGQLDKYKEKVKQSALYNFEKWGISPINYNEGDSAVNLTYDQEVERLRSWIKERLNWVDKNIKTLSPTPCTVKYVANGKTIYTGKEYIGKKLSNIPTVPKKKGYEFTGWTTKYHLTYDEYIILHPDLSTDDLDDETKAELEDIKKKGYDYEGDFDTYDAVPKSITLTAKYIPENEVVKAKKIYLNKTKVNISTDIGVATLIATVAPFDTTFSNLKWSSSDENVVTVDDGMLNVVAPGDAVVTVSTDNGVKATCKVHVCNQQETRDFDYESYLLDDNEITMNVGEYRQLNITSTPDNAIYSEFPSFIGIDESIAEVGVGGVIHAVAEGKTAVVMVKDGDVSTCIVNVVDKSKNVVKKGSLYNVKGNIYKVTYTGKKNTVTFVGVKNKKVKSVKVPGNVKISNKTFKVTAIENKAFANLTNVKKITIGKNVAKLTKTMFAKNKELKKIVLKARKTKIAKGTFSKKVKVVKPKKTVKKTSHSRKKTTKKKTDKKKAKNNE